jgi:hypothetical protein
VHRQPIVEIVERDRLLVRGIFSHRRGKCFTPSGPMTEELRTGTIGSAMSSTSYGALSLRPGYRRAPFVTLEQ